MKATKKILRKHIYLDNYTEQYKKAEFWIMIAMKEYAKKYHKKMKNK